MFNIQLRVLYIQWLTINKTILTIKIPTLSFESVINFEIVQSGLHEIYIYIYIFNRISFRDRSAIFFKVSKLSIFVTISKNRVDKSYLTKQKKSIDERSIKKKEEEKRATITAAYFRAYHRDFAEKKKNSLSQDENSDTKSWRFDRISWLQENGVKLARNAAKCFYYSSVRRRPKANRRDKSKRLRCFYKLHTWTRRRRETEPIRSIPVRLFIRIFLFPSEGTLIRPTSPDFGFFAVRRIRCEKCACFYWISKTRE